MSVCLCVCVQRVDRVVLAQAVDKATAGAALADTQARALQQLVQEVGFCANAFASDLGCGETVQSFRGRDETRAAWLSSLKYTDESKARFALQAWNGPEVDVPNLFVQTTVSSEGIDVVLDLRPRLDAGKSERERDHDCVCNTRPHTHQHMYASRNRKFPDLI